MTDWLYYLIFPGGAGRMDAAVDDLVGPALAVTRTLPGADRWFFVRYVEERGPHVRLRVRVRDELLDGAQDRLDGLLADGLEGVVAAPPSSAERLVPVVDSRPQVTAHVGVHRSTYQPELKKYGGAEGVDMAEGVFQVSSEVVIGASPLLAERRDRAAFALVLMEETGTLGLPASLAEDFWRDYLGFWGKGLRRDTAAVASVLTRAAELGEDLRERGARLRDADGVNVAIGRYSRALIATLAKAAGIGAQTPSHLFFHQTHMTNNRLGLSAAEEALVAAVLAAPEAASRAVRPLRPERAEDARARAGAQAPPPEAGSQPAVEFVDLRKSYGDNEAVRGVTLTIHRGEVFGMLGPNGAGKTTMLEMAVGMRTPTSGLVRVLGLDPRSDRDELLQRVAVQPQQASLFVHARVGEILALWSSFYPKGYGPQEILQMVGLEEKADDLVRTLSGGQRQRLLLGVALTAKPEMLFLDEPTEGLDPNARQALWKLIGEQRERGRTVVLTTHGMEEADSLCDRVAIVVRGEIVALGTPARLVHDHFPEQAVSFDVDTEPDPAMLERLHGAERATVTSVADGFRVSIETKRPDELFAAMAEEQALPSLQGLTLRECSLQDVFVKLTNSTQTENGDVDAADPSDPRTVAEKELT